MEAGKYVGSGEVGSYHVLLLSKSFFYWNEMLFQKFYFGHRAQRCGSAPLFGNANAMRRSFI